MDASSGRFSFSLPPLLAVELGLEPVAGGLAVYESASVAIDVQSTEVV